MNILYFFQEIGTPMFQWQRVHIIDELQRRNCKVEIFNPLLYNSPQEANEKLIRRINQGKIDLFFTNICYYKQLFVETLEYIKQRGIPTLSLRCDNLVVPFMDKVLCSHFDLVWLTSIETKHLYDKWNAKSFFAPYAANPYTFSFTEYPIKRKVTFIGTPYGSRSIMINALTSHGVDTDVFFGKQPGVKEPKIKIPIKYNIISPNPLSVILNRFRFKEGRKLLHGKIANIFAGQKPVEVNEHLTRFYAIPPSEISKYYSEYAISLASTSTNHTDVLKNPLKIVNLRNFEIPMSGGIELCKYNAELAGYFDEDKEILFYHTNEELADKARFYTTKASDREILNIKKAARKKAEAEHTWWNRFGIAFNILGIKYI